jgi:VWFA-related protein
MWVLRRQVNEVTVMFTATRKGKYVTGLQADDVQVRDDKRAPAAIVDFRNEQNLPLRLGLLIDTSGSVKDRFRFETQVAGQFVGEIVDPSRDQVFVAGFSHRMRVIQDFTGDAAKISSGLLRLRDDREDTSVFDSVVAACQKLAAGSDTQPVARVLVVISDGDDNASKLGLKEAAEIAQWDQVTIFTIITRDSDWDYLGDEALHKVAEQSGGRALYSGSKKQLAKAFARIQRELRNRYAVSYRPAKFTPDGHFRRIRIVARRFGNKLHVHARKGYYARSPFPDLPAVQDKH